MINQNNNPLRLVLLIGSLLFSSLSIGQTEHSVSVKPFSQIAHSRAFSFPASVVNLQIAEVAAESAGRIISFPLQVGDSVKQGQRLVELDCKTPRINQQRVKAGLKRLRAKKQLTEQQLKRAQSLLSSRSISREEVDQRQTQLEADSASIEEQQALIASANKSVSDCQISAPYFGTIIEKLSYEGSYASPGSPMLRLLQDQNVELEAELPVSAISNLRKASKIQFSAEKQSYPVSIRRILPLVNSRSLQQTIRLSFSGKDKPVGGSFGLVSFESAQRFLPAHVIQKRNGEFGVFLLRDNSAIFKVLKNTQEGQSVETDLAADERIIVDNLKNLRSGDPVISIP